MMSWYQDGMSWGGWLVMLLGIVAFWGLVVWAVVVLFRDTHSEDARPAHHDPLDTLEERFARVRAVLVAQHSQAELQYLRTHGEQAYLAGQVARDAALAKLHAAGVDEALFIWIAHDVAPRAMSPRIRGYVQPQSWFVDLRLPSIQ